MINPSHDTPMWIIEDHEIGPAFDMAMSEVRHRFWKRYNNPCGGYPRDVLVAINRLGARPFARLEKAQVERLLTCCFGKNNQREIIVNETIPNLPTSRFPPFYTILKLVFLRLWIEKKVLLPLNWNSPINCDEILDEIILEQSDEHPLLLKIRALNKVSSIVYTGSMSDKDRELRASFWFRLLLASNHYNPDSFTMEVARDLKARSYGRNAKLARFYTDDFSIFIANASSSDLMRERIDAVLSESREVSKQRHRQSLEKVHQKKINKQHVLMLKKTRDYLDGSGNSIDQFIAEFSDARILNAAFRIDESGNLPGGLELLPEKITSFCLLINTTFNAFLRSRRLENTKNHKSSLYHLLAYCGPYLYKFFMTRDGNLENYPATFNDFSCALYITADADFLNGLGHYDKALPETLLSLMRKLMDANGNTADTQYQRIYPIEDFFEFIIAQSAVIPNADKVRNSFSPDCYPKQIRKWGTVKKPIPRAYFSTFLSMLYSFEYLTMHLNAMAEGVEPGVLNGNLTNPTLSELAQSSDWAGLWGSGTMSCANVDLTKLNYTPIFYHDRKAYKFNYMPRFYRISDMHVNGRMQPRIIMNDVRTTILMCETGIRQQHLLWLDLDNYARYIDKSIMRPLAPLLVSTDKAHGEWTSIVSQRVIDLLDRQRAWYESCTDPKYIKPIWYNLNGKSKFGKLRPLFRLPLALSSWFNYEPYRLFLLCLQYFYKTELQDPRCPDIVWIKSPPSSDEKIRYIMNYSEKDLKSITASTLTSEYTPHGLRAGFVSEAIKFLPPSIVGQWLTGQSEPLVGYYSVFDETDLGMTHQEMLCMTLMKNHERLVAGDLPELAQAISNLNASLATDITSDPVTAISKHRLVSISSVKRDADTGLDRILAKEVSELAFNTTHICPFNNICPKEVIDLFGEPNCCSACPYAIRGVAHLPAISAKKDKYKELMSGTLKLIQQYLARKPSARLTPELEQLESQNDRFAREACLLEAIESQLHSMCEEGVQDQLMIKEKEQLLNYYDRHALPQEAQLLKRLIDVQNFPDASSEDLSMKLSYLRHALLIKEGKLEELLCGETTQPEPISTRVAAQISGMLNMGAIDEFELFGISAGNRDAIQRLHPRRKNALQLSQHLIA